MGTMSRQSLGTIIEQTQFLRTSILVVSCAAGNKLAQIAGVLR